MSFLETLHDPTKFIYERMVKQSKCMAEYANKTRISYTFNINHYV